MILIFSIKQKIVALCTGLLFVVLAIPQTADAYFMTADVSAYTATGSPMANGEYPYWGAVASNDLPLGTRVKINGCVFTVTDRMASGYSNTFDIFMPSYEDAINWGRQTLIVEVL